NQTSGHWRHRRGQRPGSGAQDRHSRGSAGSRAPTASIYWYYWSACASSVRASRGLVEFAPCWPPINVNSASGHEAECLRRQEDRGVGDFLDPSPPSQCHTCCHTPVDLIRIWVGALQDLQVTLSFYGARSNAIDPNVVGRPLHRQGRGEINDCRLRGPIVRHHLRATHTSHRSDVNNNPLATLDHVFPHGLAKEKYAMQIDAHDCIPTVQADAFYRGAKAGTVIVDEHINLAKFLKRPLHHTVHLVGVAHINREGESAFTESADSLSRRFQMLQTPTTEHDVSTGTGTFKGKTLTDANPTTRDNNRLTLKCKRRWGHGCGSLQETPTGG